MALVITGEKRDVIDIDLVGKKYKIKKPKTAVSLIAARSMGKAGNDAVKIIDATERWLKSVFGVKVTEEIMARLEDPEDDVDFPQIVEMQTKIIEEMTGNPTT